jgi:signal transduction histidine kinase
MAWFRLLNARFVAVPILLTLLATAVMVGSAAHIVARFRATQLHAHVEVAGTLLTTYLEPYAKAHASSSASTRRALEDLEAALARLAEKQPKMVVLIWLPEGRLLYTSSAEVIPAEHDDAELRQALLGEKVVEFETEADGEAGGPLDLPFLEIYLPIFDSGQEQPIAIGEVYIDARALAADGDAFERTVWLTTGAATLALVGMLAFSARQGEILRLRLEAEQELVRQNDLMRRDAEAARLSAAEASEQTLNFVGAEIHDGPLQLLSLAAMGGAGPKEADGAAGGDQQDLVRQAVTELRRISTGLILPEVEMLNPRQIIELAISQHRSIAVTPIDFAEGNGVPLPDLDLPRRICLFRVVQEGLTNATRHGGDGPIRVSAEPETAALVVTIASPRASSQATTEAGSQQKLGLQGMRRRLSAFGGAVELKLQGNHAILRVAIPVAGQQSGGIAPA